MDISSIIGLAGAFGMIVMSIITGGGSIMSVVDLPSFLMVVLGSWFALLLATSLSDGLGVFNLIGRAFRIPVFNEQGIITKLMAFSEKARREGLLALEDELEDLDDEFMKKGLRLVVDGTDAEIIRNLMELELSQMNGRHMDKISIITMWATLGPGLGMLGTVVGLIGMLQNLDDKASIGPNMALALVTTFYGSVVANLLMIPFANKLKGHDAKETVVKEMVIEGVLSIQAGDNTRILAMKLLAYLNPTDRRAMEAEILKD
jgi:chemotaxis protein MotA